MKRKDESLEDLRRRAENRLQERKGDLSTAPTPEELRRIVHELAVHQIELEMQNEELQHARAELETYLRRYTDLYDFAPVGYLMLDPEGRILQSNLTGARMLGTDRSQLLEQYFSRFVSVDSRPAVALLLNRVFQEQSRDAAVIELCSTGSEACYAHVEAVVADDGRECRIVLMDITAQRLAEESLKTSEWKYRRLFESMSEGVIYQCPDGRITSANPSAERILGVSIRQMEGRKWTDLFSEVVHADGSEFPEDTHPYIIVLQTREAVQDVVMGVSLPGYDRRIWLNINAVPQFRPGEGSPFQVFMTLNDITEHKRLATYNTLTPREKAVFALVGKPLSRRAIADILGISPKTVDKHRENLMAKLNIYETEGLVGFARLIGRDRP